MLKVETNLPGLYPKDHGITGNRMYDPQTGKVFSLSNDAEGNPQNSDPFWFADHVPLWATTTSQGKRTSVRGGVHITYPKRHCHTQCYRLLLGTLSADVICTWLLRYWSSCDVPFMVGNVTVLPEVRFAIRNTRITTWDRSLI